MSPGRGLPDLGSFRGQFFRGFFVGIFDTTVLTPRPWELRVSSMREDDPTATDLYAALGEIQSCDECPIGSNVDMEFARRAVNAHDALVEALEAVAFSLRLERRSLDGTTTSELVCNRCGHLAIEHLPATCEVAAALHLAGRMP